MVSTRDMRYALTAVESSDERATAHLIAERTLALAPEVETHSGQADPRMRWYAVAAGAVILVGGAITLWVSLGGAHGHGDRPTAPDHAAASGDSMTRWMTAGAAGQSRAQTAPAEDGILNCIAWPSAKVYLNGRRFLGSTPLSGVRLSPGSHLLFFVSKDGSLRKEVPLTIARGETRTLSVALER